MLGIMKNVFDLFVLNENVSIICIHYCISIVKEILQVVNIN